MNSQVDVDLDAASRSLNLSLSDLNIKDIWRVHQPAVKVYTFISTRNKTFLRIDYSLVSSDLVPLVNSVWRMEV